MGSVSGFYSFCEGILTGFQLSIIIITLPQSCYWVSGGLTLRMTRTSVQLAKRLFPLPRECGSSINLLMSGVIDLVSTRPSCIPSFLAPPFFTLRTSKTLPSRLFQADPRRSSLTAPSSRIDLPPFEVNGLHPPHVQLLALCTWVQRARGGGNLSDGLPCAMRVCQSQSLLEILKV